MRITRPLRLGSAGDLRPELPLADLDGLAKIAGGGFEESRPMLWIEGQDLLGDRPLWLPYETVHANYTLPLPPGSGCFAASTNGLASGNHILEAISHGLCEVIERDAGTLWQLLEPGARAATRVELDSVDDPDCCAVLDRFAAAGLDDLEALSSRDLGEPITTARSSWVRRTMIGPETFYVKTYDYPTARDRHRGLGRTTALARSRARRRVSR